jgi:enoyl-CoA hydratase/carnithine racemase
MNPQPTNPQPTMVDSLLNFNEQVATLTFNRDNVRNELTGTQLVDDICNTIDWIANTPEVRALIITGNGRAFSAGGNIKDIRDRKGVFDGSPAQINENYRHSIQRMSLAMHSVEVPVIAAVNGPGIGAGFHYTFGAISPSKRANSRFLIIASDPL